MIPRQTSKLGVRRVGPFPTVEKIRRLASRLDLPQCFQIYPVISVAQLEPASPGEDPYERELFPEPGPAEDEENPTLLSNIEEARMGVLDYSRPRSSVRYDDSVYEFKSDRSTIQSQKS